MSSPLFAVLQSDPLIPTSSVSRASSQHPPSPPKTQSARKPSGFAGTLPPPSPGLLESSPPHPPLSLRQESQAIKRSLQSALKSRGDGMTLDYACRPCDADTLVSTVTDPRLKVLHYSGHGTDKFITIENEDGSTGVVEGGHLKDMLSRRGKNVDVVFIAACQSEGMAGNFVQASIPHVIAVTTTSFVLDSNARVFATTFYACLIGGQTVQKAFNNARDRVRMGEDEMELTGRGGEGMFKLMGSGDHDNDVIFPLGEGGRIGFEEMNDISPELPGSTAPPPPSSTISHLYTVHSIYSSLATSLTEVDSPRLVTVKGVSGVGKTHLCLVAMRYLRERGWKFGLSSIFNCDMTGHLGDGKEGRRKRRCKETLEWMFERAGGGGHGKRVVFMDNIDIWVGSSTLSFSKWVAEVLQRHQDLTILCTAREPLFAQIDNNRKDVRTALGEAVVHVPPLDNYSSAKMLIARSSRVFQKRELHGGIFVSSDMEGLDEVEALGEGAVIEGMGGIPAVVSEVANAVENLNLVSDEGKILNIVIPKAKSGNRCRGVWTSAVGKIGGGWGKWKDVSEWLAKDFSETVEGGRSLGDKCLDMIGDKFAILKKEGRIVEEEVFFGRLWTWWRGAVAAASRCGALWERKVREEIGAGGNSKVDNYIYGKGGAEGFYMQATPYHWAVGGFIDRVEAERLVVGKVKGTFVVRLSSEVGCLAITYNTGGDGGAVSVLVKPTREVVTGWEMAKGGGGVKYSSLGELVMGIDELKYLWPGVEKEVAFAR